MVFAFVFLGAVVFVLSLWIVHLRHKVHSLATPDGEALRNSDILGISRLAVATISGMAGLLGITVAALSFYGFDQIRKVNEQRQVIDKELASLRDQVSDVTSAAREIETILTQVNEAKRTAIEASTRAAEVQIDLAESVRWLLGKSGQLGSIERDLGHLIIQAEAFRDSLRMLSEVMSKASLTHEVTLRSGLSLMGSWGTVVEHEGYEIVGQPFFFQKDALTKKLRVEARIAGGSASKEVALRMAATDDSLTFYSTDLVSASDDYVYGYTDLDISGLKNGTCRYFWEVRGYPGVSVEVIDERISLIKGLAELSK